MSTSPPSAPRLTLPAGPWVGFAVVFVLFTVLIAIKGDLGTFLSLGNLRVLLHEGRDAYDPAAIDYAMGIITHHWGRQDDLRANMLARQDEKKVTEVLAQVNGLFGK